MRYCPRARPIKIGMTILELLVAMALSTMLVVSVLSVLTALESHRRELAKQTTWEPWRHLLARQLRRDLANARRVHAQPGRLVLTGYLGTDGPLLQSTFRVAEVTYQLAASGGTSYLVRDERPLDRLTNAVGTRQLMAGDVTDLQLTGPESILGSGDTYAGPVPSLCRIRVWCHGSSDPEFEVSWSR